VRTETADRLREFMRDYAPEHPKKRAEHRPAA
jgi:hypothetical protein